MTAALPSLSPPDPAPAGHRRRPFRAMAGLLVVFAAFFVLYFAAGSALSRTSAFAEDDILFELDTPRVIGDMTRPQANHYRTKVHPLYVLLVNPWGALAAERSGSEVDAAVLLNSLMGAAGVALGFLFFWLLAGRLADAVLLAALFGLSASQWILSAVPETPTLAVCSLLVTYILFLRTLRTGRSRLPAWIPAGVFSLGVTTTNFAQTAICFAIADFLVSRPRGWRRSALRLVAFLSGVLAVAAALAVLQRALYPSSNLFFLPDAFREDMDFASLQVLRSPLPVAVQLFKNFAWIDFIAPDPVLHPLPQHKLPGVTFSTATDFALPGILATVLWFGLWLASAPGALRRRGTAGNAEAPRPVLLPLAVGLLLCVAFNLLLHSVYGVGEKGRIEYFLYTGNFTFPVLALWALPVVRSGRAAVRALLLALVVCTGLGNRLVLQDITGMFAGLRAGTNYAEAVASPPPPPEPSWTRRQLAIPLPPVPEPGGDTPPPCILLRLEVPAAAAEVPVRVSLGDHPLREDRMRPGAWFLAVPWNLLETARREAAAGDAPLELRLDADSPIPDALPAAWLNPDGPLEMSFDPAQGPSSESYLSWADPYGRRWRDAAYEHLLFPMPVRSTEFDGDGTIALPPGLDGGVGEPDRLYLVKLTMTAVYGDEEGRLAVSLSLPEFPDTAPQTVVRPHSDRQQVFRFVLDRLPRAPERLDLHVAHEIEYPGKLRKNPRHANVRLDALQLYRVRRSDTWSVAVGNSGDALLLGDGFFGRESPGSSRHARWTGGEFDLFLPLEGGRDCRLSLDFDSMRPEGAPPVRLQLELNGHPLETTPTATGLEARLPAEWLGGTGRLVARTPTWSPADYGAGDTRRLGIYLRAFRVAPL
ncbi:MAG: hypothetical protein IKO01_01590 [Kiritimatiellae bacterium]|nr:hypothetical protein [Kiritimatiellia bacterium]